MIARGDRWELRLGDFRDPKMGLCTIEEVDHTFTDPPYSEGLYTRTRTNAGSGGARSTNMQSAVDLASGRIGSLEEVLEEAAEQFARVTKRWIHVWGDEDSVAWWREQLISRGLSRRRSGVWLKPDPMPQVSADRPGQDVEYWTLFHREGRSVWNGGGKGASVVHPRCKGHERPNHPSPKPLGVMVHFIDLLTSSGDLICDPFAGSGSTGVAAVLRGRRFIGWERDVEYFEEARMRLRAVRPQVDMWESSPPMRPRRILDRCPHRCRPGAGSSCALCDGSGYVSAR